MSTPPAAPLAELVGVGKIYKSGHTHIVAMANVTFAVGPGEYVAIVGPSGSGKTTCLNMLGCLDIPTTGLCRIAGQDTSDLGIAERAALRRDHIGFVFQGFNLMPRASACDNVMLPLIYRGIARRQRERMARNALEQVGLGRWADSLPLELSGGQQQRVAVARAIVCEPRLLIADEPTGALDSATGGQIVALLEDLNARLGLAMVIVTHDTALARRARRQIVFADGQILRDVRSEASNEAA